MTIKYDEPGVLYDDPRYTYDGDRLYPDAQSRLRMSSIFAHVETPRPFIRIGTLRPLSRL